MRVSLIQMNSNGTKQENEKKAFQFLNQAVQEKPDIICLSELFLSWGPDFDTTSFSLDELKKYQDFALKNKVNIILGSVSLEQKNTSKKTNTCFTIDRNGDIIGKYSKIYMYKVNRDNFIVDEEEDTIPGKELGVVTIDGIKIGIGICFDLRFPEYFRELIKEGAEIIFLPSHFRKETGFKAWDILVNARALENQVYFCACNQTGSSLCGKTKIVDYEGETLKIIEEEEGIITLELDLESERKFRKKFPVLEQIK